MAVLLLAAPAAAATAAAPPVALAFDGCAEIGVDEVRRLTGVELGRPPGNAADAADVTRVVLICPPATPDLVRIEVRDPTTGKTLERALTLGGVPGSDRARLLALAAAELVAASWTELRQPSVTQARAIDATASPETQALARRAAEQRARMAAAPLWRWSVLATARGMSDLPRPLLGGGLAAQRALPFALAGALDLVVEGGDQPASIGSVDALLVSAGVSLLARAAVGPVAWESGIGARGGLVRLAGNGGGGPTAPVRGLAMTGPWAGPLALIRGVVALPRAMTISLGVEAGYVTAAVVGRVDGAPQVAVQGLWWGATLGAGLAR